MNKTPEITPYKDPFGKILKKIPLDTRMKVLNEMMIMGFLVDIGYIPDGGWTDEKEEKYGIEFRAFAKKLTDAQIEEYINWEKDGRPKDEKN